MKGFSSAVAALLVSNAVAGSCKPRDTSCHCLPEDSCWPASNKWDALNSTVGGRLIATVPIGSPCHDPNYDAAACAALQADWNYPQTQYVVAATPLLVAEC
jgi:hypothetical protein